MRLQGDGNYTYDNDIFMRMAAGAEMNNTLDEYWDIVKKTFATEGEAYIFYNKYARDKGVIVRKQKVRRAKYSGQLLFRRFLFLEKASEKQKWLFKFIINGKGCWWGCTKRCTAKLSIWLPIYFISIVGLWQLVL